MDEDGYVFLVDRIKDLIICSGFNVYPRTIEEALSDHPAVDENNVIGVPDEYRGEVPVAFVKLRAGATATEEELKKFLAVKINKLEMPREIIFRGFPAQDADRQALEKGASRGIQRDERAQE